MTSPATSTQTEPDTHTSEPDAAERPAPAATLSEADAARYLGDFSRAYLEKARHNNKGPAYLKIGRTIRYLPRDLDAWLLKHRRTTRESA